MQRLFAFTHFATSHAKHATKTIHYDEITIFLWGISYVHNRRACLESIKLTLKSIMKLVWGRRDSDLTDGLGSADAVGGPVDGGLGGLLWWSVDVELAGRSFVVVGSC